MEQKQTKTTSHDSKLEQLNAILFLLQTNLEQFTEEVNSSYELLKVGKKTELIKSIEDLLQNPLDSMANMTSQLDENINKFIDVFVKSFIKHNKSIIESAFRSKTSMHKLHYAIVLKEDSIENRNKIFDFFNVYDLSDISERHPVFFQIFPKELSDRIRYTEKITFD